MLFLLFWVDLDMKKCIIFLSLLLFGICSCSSEKQIIEYDLNDLIKFENKFIYKTLNKELPSGKVYKVLKSGKKKYIGKLSKGIPYGDWSKLNDEGDVLEIINFAKGIPGRRYVIIYHDNGQKHIEGSYFNSKKNGLFKMYYKNGIESYRGEYLNDSGIGFWSYFDENGKMIKKIDCSIEECR